MKCTVTAPRAPRLSPAILTISTLLALGGCASVDRNIKMIEQTVTPVAAGEAADISADDLAEAMLRAGFTREHILEHGPDLRNALATSGGAQVRDEDVVAAMFSVHANKLYVTSRARGTFVQPLASAGPELSGSPQPSG